MVPKVLKKSTFGTTIGTFLCFSAYFSIFYSIFAPSSKRQKICSKISFEQLCLHHIPQIKQKLGILGVQTNVYSWQQKTNKEAGMIQSEIVLDDLFQEKA